VLYFTPPRFWRGKLSYLGIKVIILNSGYLYQ